MKPVTPTSHPDVNHILDVLYTNIKEILKDQLAGMYIHGSLANGGFDAHSDIDVIVMTAGDISDETFESLKDMHKQIAQMDSPWAVQLEVAYIPEDALRRADPPDVLYPHLDRGSGEVLHRVAPDRDWNIPRHILRERGIVIRGPDPKSLIDPVPSEELREAVREGLPIWFTPILNDPSEISKRGYQSFFVLSICRMLYTLEHGEILSKQAAAAWALKHMDAKWKPLIERAQAGRQYSVLDADPEDINGTLDMMRYALKQVTPTPYPDVNQLLHLLRDNVKKILGEKFIGMYLYGSLSSGDFDPDTSDIDFLIVTSSMLSDQAVANLEAMHGQTWATSLTRAGKLEGSYVPRALIRRHDPAGAACPTVNEGRFSVAPLGSDWIIQRHVVREYGVVVEGPDPKTLIDPVRPTEIRDSILGVLHEWWFPVLDDPSWLREHDNAYCAFAVITMCRVLHSLEHGTIVSKPKAIHWARESLSTSWLPLIDKAVAASRHEAQEDFLDETLDFIRFIKDQTAKLEK